MEAKAAHGAKRAVRISGLKRASWVCACGVCVIVGFDGLEGVPPFHAVSAAPDVLWARPDVEALGRVMLAAVNRDRESRGIRPLEWDPIAATAGQRHAEEMAHKGYMSHWNLAGYGPDHRYSMAGGRDSVMENVALTSHTFDDGRPAPIADFEQVVREAQERLMKSSGHRINILAPEHTHLGVGLAYDAEAGRFSIAQEFVNHYVDLLDVPRKAVVGQSLLISGRVIQGGDIPTLNLAYQPFPSPRSVEDLNRAGPYRSKAGIYRALAPGALSLGRFEQQVLLSKEGKPGLYSIRIWVRGKQKSILASDLIIEVR